MTAPTEDPRESPAAADRLATALAERFAHEGVDPGYLAFVLQHLHRPDAEWRWCCGSNCDPCVEQLGRLVDAARRHLDLPPP